MSIVRKDSDSTVQKCKDDLDEENILDVANNTEVPKDKVEALISEDGISKMSGSIDVVQENICDTEGGASGVSEMSKADMCEGMEKKSYLFNISNRFYGVMDIFTKDSLFSSKESASVGAKQDDAAILESVSQERNEQDRIDDVLSSLVLLQISILKFYMLCTLIIL